MNRWRIGDVAVTRVVEMEIAGGTRFILPDATPENVLPIDWLAPHFMTAEGRLIMSIHAFIIETRDRRIVVDTCVGNDKVRSIPGWNMMQGPFLREIAAAGYPRETVDTVLCTHLHVDHVGWNTMLVDGAWQPTFPNARYLIGKLEWEYWRDEPDKRFGDVIGDSVRPIFDAGLVDLVEADHVLCDEVRLQPTFGHTPGHVSVRIISGGEEAFITGDWIHHPCQMARPDWGASTDFAPPVAELCRRRLLDLLSGTPILVIGTHFATPTVGRIVRDKDAFRFDSPP